MKPIPLWTGIAVLTLALTVAEVAAVGAVAHGARQWWAGDDADALRRAGRIVGDMVAEQVGLGSDVPVRVQLADLRLALEPMAGCDGAAGAGSIRCVLRDRTFRTRIIEARLRGLEARSLAREKMREMIRRSERQVL